MFFFNLAMNGTKCEPKFCPAERQIFARRLSIFRSHSVAVSNASAILAPPKYGGSNQRSIDGPQTVFLAALRGFWLLGSSGGEVIWFNNPLRNRPLRPLAATFLAGFSREIDFDLASTSLA